MLHWKWTVTNAAAAQSENLNKEHQWVCCLAFFPSSFFVEKVLKLLNPVLTVSLMSIYKHIEKFVQK